MTLWVCALVAPGGPLARLGSSHCPRRSLRLIAVATCCSSGTSGFFSHACGTSPVQTVPGGTWLAGVWSCTRHSGNCLSSQSSRFEVSTFSPHSGSACHLMFSCRLPCWPNVASLPCILPREPYKLLRLSSKRGPEHPLYFRAVWPFGVHGGTFRRREEWAHLGLWLRLWIGRWWRWGRSRLQLGPFGPAGPGVRSPSTRPRLGLGLFWCRFGGRLWRVAVLKDAVCRSLPLSWSVHTSKSVFVFL